MRIRSSRKIPGQLTPVVQLGKLAWCNTRPLLCDLEITYPQNIVTRNIRNLVFSFFLFLGIQLISSNIIYSNFLIPRNIIHTNSVWYFKICGPILTTTKNRLLHGCVLHCLVFLWICPLTLLTAHGAEEVSFEENAQDRQKRRYDRQKRRCMLITDLFLSMDHHETFGCYRCLPWQLKTNIDCLWSSLFILLLSSHHPPRCRWLF